MVSGSATVRPVAFSQSAALLLTVVPLPAPVAPRALLLVMARMPALTLVVPE